MNKEDIYNSVIINITMIDSGDYINANNQVYIFLRKEEKLMAIKITNPQIIEVEKAYEILTINKCVS
jgi:hypothetical protein